MNDDVANPYNKTSIEYMMAMEDGVNGLLGGAVSLLAFFGGRDVVSTFYQRNRALLCNPFLRFFILFSVIYINIKNVKYSIIFFFLYILLIDDYINNCSIQTFEDDNDSDDEDNTEKK